MLPGVEVHRDVDLVGLAGNRRRQRLIDLDLNVRCLHRHLHAPFIVLTAAVSVPPRLGRSVPALYISMCSKVSRKELQKFIPMPKIGSSSRHWKFWQRFLLDISEDYQTNLTISLQLQCCNVCQPVNLILMVF